jgi:hypothetical protein
MDDDMQVMEFRDREIELRLESYARVRLSPDPQAVARARARIMREARLQFEAALTAERPTTVVIHPGRSLFRRLAMPALAASVWVVIGAGSIFAAQAGGPLYTTRMWVESATLPSAGDARAHTELTRLDARLAEAMAAASRGDNGAVQAALDAYRQIADEAIAGTAGDAALQAVVADALDKHLATLTAVADRLGERGNDTAAAAVEAAIQRTIDHNQAVVDRVDGRGAGSTGNGGAGGDGSNAGGQGAGTGGGGGTGGGAGAGNGGGTGPGTGAGGGSGTGGTDGKPAKTPKPTQDPAATHAPPDHTPRGPRD